MLSMSRLSARSRVVYQTLKRLQAQFPDGVPALVLATSLQTEDATILDAIQAMLGNLQPERPLQLCDVERLKEIVQPLEKRQQASLLSQRVGRIMRWSASSDQEIHHADVERLVRELSALMKQNVEKSVSKLRDRLVVLSRQDGQMQETISRSPYRIMLQQSHLEEGDVRTLQMLHAALDRPAWLRSLRPVEGRNFLLAQDRLRHALATGCATDDAGHPIPSLTGRRRQRVRDAGLRRKLDCVNELSRRLEEIYGLYYAPHPEAPDPDRCYVMKLWARPVAVDIVAFLNGGRNAILHALNPFFVRVGEKRHMLIKGHGFPQTWVPEGALPDKPLLPNRETLRLQYDRLLAVGEQHRFDGSSGMA